MWTKEASIWIYFKGNVCHASTDIIFLFIMFFVCVFGLVFCFHTLKSNTNGILATHINSSWWSTS